tara:strand:- start:79 stop:264 length:186 start_codon:yes stop_codon:yes gene_type:complete
MEIKDLHRKINKAIDNFEDGLDLNNFGLHIDPKPLKSWEQPESEEIVIEEQEEYEELDFSS